MSSTPNATTTARETAKNNPLENATTLRGIYDDYKEKDKIDNYRFPAWVLDKDRWNSDKENSHKFDDTIVVYDDDSKLNEVKELVEEREPVNIEMDRRYNETNLKKNFGWGEGAYDKSKKTNLYPNIGIYCHARVTNGVNTGAEEKNVHVMNLIGYAFDSITQPDYIYFLNRYGGDGSTHLNLNPLTPVNKENLKLDLIQRYRKIWLKACYICKFKELKNLWYYGVGSGFFSNLLPNEYNRDSGNFYPEIFAPAFGIDPTNSNNLHSTNTNENDLTIPINFCKQYKINVINLGTSSSKQIPDVLFTTDTTPEDTLYINAWDPWSIIGNGNADDNSLDGHWGRNSNMSVLGWSMTNSKLLHDIVGGDGASAETSKILSMKEILAKIQAEGGSKGAGKAPVSGDSTPPPSTPSCEIDASKSNIKNITPECQDTIFSLAPTEESKENILQKHLSVLRTDTQYASNDKLPPGSATIVDLNYYRKNYNYPTDRVKLGTDKNDKSAVIDITTFNKEISFVIQAAPGGFGAANASKESLKNCIYNSLYIANANGVERIAFPLIGAGIFGDNLISNSVVTDKNELYKLLLQGLLDYFTEFKATNKIKIVLFADGDKKTSTDDNFNKVFTEFVTANDSLKDILKKTEDFLFGAYYAYNKEVTSITQITALVNAANTEVQFGTGISGAFSQKLGRTQTTKVVGLNDKIFTISKHIDDQGIEIKKAFKMAVNEYIKNPTASSTSSPSKVATSKPLDDVIKDLIAGIKNTEDTEATIAKLSITEPTDGLVYKYAPSDASPPSSSSSASTPPAPEDKNLNYADPAIGEMITKFENASTNHATKTTRDFYLGACRSIQAAYDLDMILAGDDGNKKMRAKLLLNLRKNSLLLKVPARWDYKEMKMGVEAELTEEEVVTAKYDILQKECAKLGQTGGTDYASEDAYKLAEQLIPLNEKMEIGVLEEKNKIVQKYYPDKEFVYAPPINITPGYTKIVTQESLNCGRAALANFFGVNGLLVKGDPSKNDEIFNLNDDRPKKEINMGSICNLRAKYAKLFNNYDISTDQCPDGENYSINVLNVVLQILGYQAGKHIVFSGNTKEVSKDNRDEANNTAKDKNTLGYLVNINKGHWICYKKANFNKSEDLFYRINSTKEIDEDAVSKTTYTINQLIDMDGGNNSSLYLSIYPITILTSPATNKSLFSDFTGAKIKDHYKKEIERIETAYNWYELMKKIMSKITEEEQYKTDENRIKIMAYLSKGSDEISPDVKKKILDFFNVDSNFKKKTINIFVENVKFIFDSLNDVKIDKTLKIEYIQKENEIYIPTGEAKIRYFYNLTNSTSYNKLTFDKKKILGDSHTGQFHNLYEDIYNEAVIGNIVSGGGFKPTHNTITTHTASKSKHNTSFKVSSSSKVKAKSRSHTQRVK